MEGVAMVTVTLGLPESGILEREVARVPRGEAVLVPGSDLTRGHGTHTPAAVWKDHLIRLLDETGGGGRGDGVGRGAGGTGGGAARWRARAGRQVAERNLPSCWRGWTRRHLSRPSTPLPRAGLRRGGRSFYCFCWGAS